MSSVHSAEDEEPGLDHDPLDSIQETLTFCDNTPAPVTQRHRWSDDQMESVLLFIPVGDHELWVHRPPESGHQTLDGPSPEGPIFVTAPDGVGSSHQPAVIAIRGKYRKTAASGPSP